jgi:hypothetical protein
MTKCVIFILELGEFQPGIKTSASTMLTSVKVLSLDVRFGVHSDVMKVPTFLRCFPNAERLHIMVIVVTDSHFLHAIAYTQF